MPTALIDRKPELKRLREAIARSPQLVVLRGRRRVGKSFLLTHALRGARGLFFQADEQTERAHLDLFAEEVARLLGRRLPIRFGSWEEALETLAELAGEGPIVVALDEFQWMKAAQPALDSIVQRHWDRWQREGTPITLILSGSALRPMEQLLDPGAPLYGRADYRPLLSPLDFRDASLFASKRLSAEQKLRRFAVLGGTPQYQVWAGPGELRELIAARILSKGESLYEEPLHLLREEQEIRGPATYFAVVRAIAGGCTRVNEIAGTAQLATPNLTKMLARLETLGYLEARSPLGPKGEEPRRTSYRLADPFFRFWFRFVFPNRSLLERGRVKEVLKIVDRDLDTFMGLAFEDCCRAWAGRYAGDALPASRRLGSWWSRDGQTEIDVVGASGGRYDLLGSCKWDRRVPAGTLRKLLSHREAIGRAGSAQLAIFARGFSPQLRREAGTAGVELIDAKRLFA